MPKGPKGEKRPADVIGNAVKVMRIATGEEAEVYRLPTEAEWEYAALGGRGSRDFGIAAQLGKAIANCIGCGSPWDNRTTAPAGSFLPNAFGLHDMHGNVAEWVEDAWHDDTQAAPTDGSAWREGGDPARRVIRGGSWNLPPHFLHGALPLPMLTGAREAFIGLRVVRDMQPN